MYTNRETLLNNFLIEFLPPTNNERKYSGNKLEYIKEHSIKFLFKA